MTQCANAVRSAGVSQIQPRSDKKVSFTAMTTVHELGFPLVSFENSGPNTTGPVLYILRLSLDYCFSRQSGRPELYKTLISKSRNNLISSTLTCLTLMINEVVIRVLSHSLAMETTPCTSSHPCPHNHIF